MNEAAPLRLFIELTLPDSVVAELGRIQRACKTRTPDGLVRWVPPAGVHLTLRFLGDVARDRQPVVEAAIAAAVGDAPGARRLALNAYGTFPGGKAAPRVLFIGLKDLDGSLPALAQALDRSLAAAGWPAEGRPYRPHLTLGRVREELRPTQLSALRAAMTEWAPPPTLAVEARQLALMRSELGPGGSRYTRLFAAAL